jgi:presenilin-like A22 family membrane protease
MSENEYPTIADLHARMGELIAEGLGELPIQLLIVPDSTLQALARRAGHTDDKKPALMLDLVDKAGNAILLASAERFTASGPVGGKRTAVQ